MYPTDYQIADLLVKLYDFEAEPLESAGFDVFESGESDGGICWAGKRFEGLDVICLRGSKTFQDWARDAFAFTLPFDNKGLGPVHPGFKIGMDDCWAEIRSKTSGPWVVSGHSLGAGRAAILTGLMVLDGCAPLRRVVFGEPRPGFQQLADLVGVVPAVSYCNGSAAHAHDRVTDVPLELGIERYVHPTPLRYVSAPPAPGASSGLFSWHHMPLYREAVKVAA